MKHTWQELESCTVQGVTTICGKLTTIIVFYGPVKHYLGSTYPVILHRFQANLKQICSFSWSEKRFLVFISNILTKPFKNKLANLWKNLWKLQQFQVHQSCEIVFFLSIHWKQKEINEPLNQLELGERGVRRPVQNRKWTTPYKCFTLGEKNKLESLRVWQKRVFGC